MDNVSTLPRRSWTERASLALALLLVLVGALALFAWVFHIDSLLQPAEHAAPIKANEGLCFLAIGLALIGREFGLKRAAWAAAVPALIGIYRYHTRPWEMEHVGTICTHCSNGCKTTLGVRNDEIIRGNNRDRSGINGEFLCIKGRYAFDFTNHRSEE